MKTLIPVIDVREIPPLCSKLRHRLPSLRSYISTGPTSCEHFLLAYLSQGVPAGICYDKGMLFDVLNPSRKIEATRVVDESGQEELIQPNLLLTDGLWLWPGALLYYLRHYHLQLPDAFVHHAKARNWRIDSSSVNVEELDSEAFDQVPSSNETDG